MLTAATGLVLLPTILILTIGVGTAINGTTVSTLYFIIFFSLHFIIIGTGLITAIDIPLVSSFDLIYY